MLSSVNSHQCCGASPFLPAPVPAPIKRSRLTSTAIFLLLFKTPNLLSLYKKNYFIFKNLFFDLLIINVADRNFLFHLSWSRTFKPAPEHGLSPLFFTFLHVQKIQRYPHACFLLTSRSGRVRRRRTVPLLIPSYPVTRTRPLPSRCGPCRPPSRPCRPAGRRGGQSARLRRLAAGR